MERKVGAHVSSKGGHGKAVERVRSIGGNCLQVFSGSPRVWKREALEKYDAEAFFSSQRENGIDPVFVHAPYLVNVVSENPVTREKSLKALSYDLDFNSLIHGSGVIVHLGSHQGRGWENVREDTLRAIAGVLERTQSDSRFLIENSAGQNGKLSSELDEIRWLIDELKDPRVGWCFDTCHAWAAGYHLGSGPAPGGGNFRGDAAEAIERTALWELLSCIHVNDSRDPFGSGRDRHANIGAGTIPEEDLAHFITLSETERIPLILEVPGRDNEGPDAENIGRVLRMTGSGTGRKSE